MRSRWSGRARVKPVSTVRQAVVRFTVIGIVALGLVAVGEWLVAGRAAEREAIDDARQRTVLLARSVVGPAITEGVVAGDAAAVRTFDQIVKERVHAHEVVRVKLWTANGEVLYSDEPRLIGSQYPLGADERAVLASGETEAETSDLERPENRFDSSTGPLLEVYTRVLAPNGTPLLFETYQTRATVSARARAVLGEFAPIALGGVALSLAFLVPLGWSLARRLEIARSDRERLLMSALDASTNERREIATHLHDGVVQSLVGSSLVLAGAADQLDRLDQRVASDLLREGASELRGAVRGLRSALVEIYPPSLRRAGLGAALADLVAQLSSRDIDVSLDIADGPRLPEGVEMALFRVARECVRNIIRHAHAADVSVMLTRADSSVTLVVSDDGGGFEPSERLHQDDADSKHFGLTLIEDSLAAVGGQLRVDSTPGVGTTITARIPLR